MCPTPDSINDQDSVAEMQHGTGTTSSTQTARFFMNALQELSSKSKAYGGGDKESAATLVQRTGEPGVRMLHPKVGVAPRVVMMSGDVSGSSRNPSANANDASKKWGQARSKLKWTIPFLNLTQKVHPADFPMKSVLSHFAPSRFQRVRIRQPVPHHDVSA